ncbi:MAG: winged helix-turn-helix transcriptional regulator [Alphaproteobacteria bacterium]|nr:winged helix-turn-helix transcriptional regulator [Alphaproteobacteria bacterium]
MKQNYKNITKATGLLKIIANEKRLLILCKLSQGEACVAELMEGLELSQSALSQHLALMREHEFVETRREHQTIYYSLSSPQIKEIIKTLHKHYCTSC